MTTKELKKRVIGKIHQINDDELLADVYKLLENREEEAITFTISDDHKIAIELAKSQISSGDVISNEEANKEIEEWLKK